MNVTYHSVVISTLCGNFLPSGLFPNTPD